MEASLEIHHHPPTTPPQAAPSPTVLFSFSFFSSVRKKLSNISKSVKTTFSSIYNDDMINEWIWDKIRTKLTRVEELRKYLNEIQIAIISKHQNLTLDKKL